MPNTISSFPIDFSLVSLEDEQVLYITDDIAGQSLFLEITNLANRTITLADLPGSASETTNHFELKFRPGTVFNNPSMITVGGNAFELFLNKDGDDSIIPNADGTLSLYFKASGSIVLPENDKIRIEIQGIRADTQGGTRGTRVELNYQNLEPAGGEGRVSGFREAHLNIVNHRGRRNIPLQIGYVGPNEILNNGKAINTLRLRITNSSRNGGKIPNGPDSRLVLIIPSGGGSLPWTLAYPSQINAVQVTVTYPDSSTEELPINTGGLWNMPFQELAPGETIEVEIGNLVTGHPTGIANITLAYENIPGYWDGTFSLVVKRQPLIFDGHRVGMGTDDLEGKLTVAAERHVDGIRIINPLGGTSYLAHRHNINILAGRQMRFRDANDQEKIIFDFENNKINLNNAEIIGKTVLSPFPNNYGLEIRSETGGRTYLPHPNNWNYIAGKGVHFRDHENVTKLSYNADLGELNMRNSVLVGRFHVIPADDNLGVDIRSNTAGNTHFPHVNNWNYISGNGVVFRDADHAERVRIDANTGNVGIGTHAPEAKLHVKGDAQVDKLDVKGDTLLERLRVNSGTEFKQIQAGSVELGEFPPFPTLAEGLVVEFPEAFASTPIVICSLVAEHNRQETFTYSLTYTSEELFKLNLLRIFSGFTSKSIKVTINWIAFVLS